MSDAQTRMCSRIFLLFLFFWWDAQKSQMHKHEYVRCTNTNVFDAQTRVWICQTCLGLSNAHVFVCVRCDTWQVQSRGIWQIVRRRVVHLTNTNTHVRFTHTHVHMWDAQTRTFVHLSDAQTRMRSIWATCLYGYRIAHIPSHIWMALLHMCDARTHAPRTNTRATRKHMCNAQTHVQRTNTHAFHINDMSLWIMHRADGVSHMDGTCETHKHMCDAQTHVRRANTCATRKHMCDAQTHMRSISTTCLYG